MSKGNYLVTIRIIVNQVALLFTGNRITPYFYHEEFVPRKMNICLDSLIAPLIENGGKYSLFACTKWL